MAPQTGALECQACAHLYDLWSRILAVAPEEYGYRAFAALSLEAHLKDWPEDRNVLELEEWGDLQTVRGIIRQVEEHRNYEQWLAAQQTPKK